MSDSWVKEEEIKRLKARLYAQEKDFKIIFNEQKRRIEELKKDLETYINLLKEAQND